MVKNFDNFRFAILVCGGVVLSFFQFLKVSFWGVSPNFAILAVVLAAFFTADFFEGVFFASLATLILKFHPQPAKEIAVFFALSLLTMFFAKKMPWNIYVSFSVITLVYFALFYFFIFSGFVFSREFFIELGYNILLGIMAIFLLRQFELFRE